MSWVAIAVGTSVVGGLVSGAGSILGGMKKAEGDRLAGDSALAGANFTALAIEQGGILSQQEAEFEALQLDQAAGTARASAQRTAFERRRAGRFALSSLIARAASSGGGTEGTVLDLGKDKFFCV